MLKKFLLFLFSAFVLNTAYGQAEIANTVPFVAYWSVGDTFQFKVRKISIQWDDDILVKADTLYRDVRFKVIDSTASMYKVEWRYVNEFQDDPLVKNVFNELTRNNAYTKVIYTTDEMGEFQGVENWKEIRDDLIGELKAAMKGKLFKKEHEEAMYKKAMQPIIEAYSTKAGVEELALKELYYFHMPLGYEYTIDEVYEYEDVLPSLIGGEDMRCDYKITVDNIDRQNGICRVTEEMKVNPDDSKREVLSMMERMGIAYDKFSEEINGAKLNMEDFNTYIYNFDYGLPITINTSRMVDLQIEGEKRRKEEKIIIDLIFD